MEEHVEDASKETVEKKMNLSEDPFNSKAGRWSRLEIFKKVTDKCLEKYIEHARWWALCCLYSSTDSHEFNFNTLNDAKYHNLWQYT